MRDLDTTAGEPGMKFPETAGDLLSGLRERSGPAYQAALATLCRRYWKPVYTYVRAAWAKSNEDAKDLTQAYFLWLLEGSPLEKYDPARGTFRGYLKGTLRSFVGHEERALGALKRGGATHLVRLDGVLPRLEEMVPDPRAADPEQCFERMWVFELVRRAVERVQERYRSRGNETAFRVYEDYVLAQATPRPTYQELALKYGIKEREVESDLETLRLEVRREIRSELAQLAPDPKRLDEEWNGLFGG